MILGLFGHNRRGVATNKIFTAFGNDVVDLENQTGYSLNLTGNNVEFESFLNRVFLQDYNRIPVTYNGETNTWTNEYVKRCMIAKYLKKYKSRMFLGNCKFPSDGPLDQNSNAITYPSRVFYSELFVGNLTWGLEWGRNGKVTSGTNYLELVNPITQDFKLSGIKIGDPLFFTKGNTELTAKPYLVSRVESRRLYLTEDLPVSDTNLHFWVGSNWFDVETDDDDEVTGLGKNSTHLLVSKLNSFWFYTGSQLRQVNDSPGTSSSRSIINKGGYTYYFHGSNPKISGIYRYDGVSATRISRGIDPYILGMDTDNYTSVVGWSEGDELRFYIGDTTYRDISLTKAVVTLHSGTNAFDVSPVADVITCSTKWRQGNREDTYCGTNVNQVIQMDDGNSHKGVPIRLRLETKPYYPSGIDVMNEFTRVQVIGRQTKGLKVGFKLWDDPNRVDDSFKGLSECTDDRTEFVIPKSHNQASGISFDFSELGSLRNDTFVEKVVVFFKPLGRRIYESR